MVITIDGPALSGKSSVAEELAKRLNFYYLATGLMYRAVGFIFVKEFKYLEQALHEPVPKDIFKFFHEKNFKYTYDPKNGVQIFWLAKNITIFLKGEDSGIYASIISQNGEIRFEMLKLQRKIANQIDLVTEGRDCGTVVFTKADRKFFLTATIKERAERLIKAQKNNKKADFLKKTVEKIKDRDKRDRDRKIAPLFAASDAIVIDNSNLSLNETINQILSHV